MWSCKFFPHVSKKSIVTFKWANNVIVKNPIILHLETVPKKKQFPSNNILKLDYEIVLIDVKGSIVFQGCHVNYTDHYKKYYFKFDILQIYNVLLFIILNLLITVRFAYVQFLIFRWQTRFAIINSTNCKFCIDNIDNTNIRTN